MTAGPVHPLAQTRLQARLCELDKAPLKPQQRMYLLRTHVLSGMNHTLVLDPCTVNVLRRLDVSVRRCVRKWLRLPHDTPNAFIHGSLNDGGLGVTSLCLQIPVLKRERMVHLVSRAASGDDPVLLATLRQSPSLQRELRRWATPRLYAGIAYSSKAKAKCALARVHHSSVDGRGLRFHDADAASNSWVTSGSFLQSGSGYIHCIQMRAVSLHCAVRAARGHPRASMNCDTCGEPEGLSHIVQRCCRTAKSRDGTHDSICTYLADVLRAKEMELVQEPAIETPAGIRRPDIVVHKPGGASYVLDVTVVSNDVDPRIPFENKCHYYECEPAVGAWVRERFGEPDGQVNFAGVVFNWRRAICYETVLVL
jgi:hypothetical protein